jgi:hypothetical protein
MKIKIANIKQRFHAVSVIDLGTVALGGGNPPPKHGGVYAFRQLLGRNPFPAAMI